MFELGVVRIGLCRNVWVVELCWRVLVGEWGLESVCWSVWVGECVLECVGWRVGLRVGVGEWGLESGFESGLESVVVNMGR